MKKRTPSVYMPHLTTVVGLIKNQLNGTICPCPKCRSMMVTAAVHDINTMLGEHEPENTLYAILTAATYAAISIGFSQSQLKDMVSKGYSHIKSTEDQEIGRPN